MCTVKLQNTIPEDREIGNQLNLEQHSQEHFFDFFPKGMQPMSEREREKVLTQGSTNASY